MARLRVAVCILLLLTFVERPQTQAGDPLWGRLANAVSRIREIPAPAPDRGKLGDYATSMEKDLSTIRGAVKGDLHPTFRDSLNGDADALEDVSKQPSPIDRVLTICGGVANDLGVKRSYVLSLGGQSGPVAVETWTRKGADVRQGYDVRYTPSAFPVRQPKSFDGVSSPTREPRIAPGEYWIWSYRNGDAGERKLAQIGLNGATTAKVDVQVASKHP